MTVIVDELVAGMVVEVEQEPWIGALKRFGTLRHKCDAFCCKCGTLDTIQVIGTEVEPFGNFVSWN